MKRFALFCAAAAAFSSPAMAAQIFTLEGVTLQGGGTLTGSFMTNDALTQLLSVDITASAGSYGGFAYAAITYNSIANANWVSLPTQGFQITDAGGAQQLRLNLQPLTATGGTITSPNSYEYQNIAGSRSILSGRVVQAPVPEPATWAMMIGGFALVGASMRRKAAAVRFA